ncbi:MAG: hypothetical protein KGO94_02910 [Alphaproteobacteria bacterium]|nr:hypothetical protein [Alphaproteobacteria bacterium]
MSKLMWVLGILLAALGIALGLTTILAPGRMQAYGMLPDTAAILLVGGLVCIGLGGVIDALGQFAIRQPEMPAERPRQAEPMGESNAATMPNPAGARFGRKAVEAAAATTAVAATAAIISETGKTSVADTIAALDEAKADIKKALGGMDSLVTPADDTTAEAATAQTPTMAAAADVPHDTTEDSGLYVVEEKIIRGRPARVLSDDTVEAETDEGWMRFENLEHLNEYLDSTEEPEA